MSLKNLFDRASMSLNTNPLSIKEERPDIELPIDLSSFDLSSNDGDLWPDSWQAQVDGSAVGNALNDLWTGIKNKWYDITGQQEKTSLYQHEEEREDTKNQRTAADMAAAGLSKYGMSASASGNASGSSEVPDGLQRIAALLDLKKANAEIENVQANSNKQNAEAMNITADTKNKGQQFELNEKEYALKEAETTATIELTKTKTEAEAQSIVSAIQSRSIEAGEYAINLISRELDNALKSKDLEYYDVEHGEALKLSEAKRSEIAQSIQNYIQEIVYKQAQVSHLNKQDMVLLADLALKHVQYQVDNYNFQYSKSHGLRTTDAASRIFGINLDAGGESAIGENIKNPILKSIWENLWKPFWQWSWI